MSAPSGNDPRAKAGPAPVAAKPVPAPKVPAPFRPPPAAAPRVPHAMHVAQRRESTPRPAPPVQGVFASGQVSLHAAVPVPRAPGAAHAARTVQPLASGSPGAPPVPRAISPNASDTPKRATPAKAAAAVQRQSSGSVDAFLVNLPASHGGQPLPDTVRTKMESALGADFADVRVHVGPQASSIGALAFTRGSDIYFAPGQYNPNSLQGQQILGHELTHVVQQRQGRVSNPFGSGVAVVQDRQLEAEADRMGWRAAMTQAPKADKK